MDVEVSFPGGKRVDARVGPYVVHTDQPTEEGGDGSALSPFELFLASLATCAGLYVLAFCQARSLSTAGIGVHQHVETDPLTKLPSRILLELRLPPTFPEKYRTAVIRAAESCKIKKTIAARPAIEVVATTAVSAAHSASSPSYASCVRASGEHEA